MALAATMHQMELAKRTVNLSGGGGGSSSADQISYNNTTSGMIATNVQGAIDENATKIDDLSNKIGEDEIEVGDNVIDGLNTLNENLTTVDNRVNNINIYNRISGIFNKTQSGWAKILDFPIDATYLICLHIYCLNGNALSTVILNERPSSTSEQYYGYAGNYRSNYTTVIQPSDSAMGLWVYTSNASVSVDYAYEIVKLK